MKVWERNERVYVCANVWYRLWWWWKVSRVGSKDDDDTLERSFCTDVHTNSQTNTHSVYPCSLHIWTNQMISCSHTTKRSPILLTPCVLVVCEAVFEAKSFARHERREREMYCSKVEEESYSYLSSHTANRDKRRGKSRLKGSEKPMNRSFLYLWFHNHCVCGLITKKEWVKEKDFTFSGSFDSMIYEARQRNRRKKERTTRRQEKRMRWSGRGREQRWCYDFWFHFSLLLNPNLRSPSPSTENHTYTSFYCLLDFYFSSDRERERASSFGKFLLKNYVKAWFLCCIKTVRLCGSLLSLVPHEVRVRSEIAVKNYFLAHQTVIHVFCTQKLALCALWFHQRMKSFLYLETSLGRVKG